MTRVRILHVGGIGEHKQGDVVEDAHDGLVEIATRGIRNVADGELVAELVDAPDDELVALREKAKELGVKGNVGGMKRETLEAKIAEAEAEAEAARLAEEEAAKKAAEEEAARIAAEEAAKNAGNQ
jgi:hypothetical protein